MKKTFFILSAFLLMGNGVSLAQSEVVVGDMNNDGVLSVGDVTDLTETVVGRKAPRRISVAGNPYAADNSSLIGQWSGVSGSVTFNADGTTDFKAGYTYEYLPSQCLVVLYDETKAAKEFLQVVVLNKGKLVLSDVSMTTAYTYDDHAYIADDGTTYFEDENGHRYVDLGLPSGTLWATTNVGAENPETPGDYFAWGETETKDSYANPKYGFANTCTKYCRDDNKMELDPEDDAATMNWGDEWQMPSERQFYELFDWKYKEYLEFSQNGVIIKSRVNNNYIFMPITGAREGTLMSSYYSECGCYWSRNINTDNAYNPYLQAFNAEGNYPLSVTTRRYGCQVRPVRKSPKAN